MKQPRLPVLLTVMLALIALRWWSPPEARTEVVAAIERSGQDESSAPTIRAASVPTLSTSTLDLAAGTRNPEGGEIRNAFAPRVVAAPPPPPAPPPTPQVTVTPVVVAPPVDPTPPPPPLQVIGAWKDERGASVFIAGPQGVVQARAGDTVLTEYSVTQITPQQVQLRHLPTSRDLALAVPPAAAPTLR